MYGLFKDNDGDFRERAFANLVLAILNNPDTELRDELTSNSNQNWTNLAWELPSKGKKKSSKDKESIRT